uniref:Uncharacterized protein n=1 Tax=Rhizophora mucronata TaxID=61149 RepID=A0A2P2P1L0_RHIMU
MKNYSSMNISIQVVTWTIIVFHSWHLI